MSTKTAHHVIEDRAGFFESIPRLTCVPCEATLVRQPYMSDQVWTQRVLIFVEEHK